MAADDLGTVALRTRRIPRLRIDVMIRRGLPAIALCVALTACTGPAGSEDAIASPAVVACDEAAAGIKARVEEAREILAERAPAIGDGLQKIVDLIGKERARQADAVYVRLRDSLEKVEVSSNQLLARLDETATECEMAAAPECWSHVTSAYEEAGSSAIDTLQGPLRTTLQRVERFFSLNKKATTKETRSAYMELRDALRTLRDGVMTFADVHNAAVEEVNACSTA